MVRRRFLLALALWGCPAPKEDLHTVVPPPAKLPDRVATQSVEVGPWITQVVAGWDSTCVRSRAGKVACFGQNVTASYEELALDSGTPVVIDVPPSAEIAAGAEHWCSRDADGGQVRCWGSNRHLRLGRRTPEETDYRALPVASIKDAQQVAVQGARTCVKTGARAVCWGGEYTRKLDFETHVLGVDARRIVVADSELLCEVGSSLRCFDKRREEASRYVSENMADLVLPPQGGSYGGLGGHARPDNRLYRCEVDLHGAPHCRGQRVSGPPSRAVAVGAGHMCGIREGDTLWCIGDNKAGQIGIGDSPYFHEPQEPLDETVHAVAAGSAHTCAITTDGDLQCWGLAVHGQTGLPPLQGNDKPRKVAVDERIQRVFAVANTTCIETPSGLRCSGFGGRRACGSAGFRPVDGVSKPIDVRGDGAVVCIAHDGDRLSCKEDGEARDFEAVDGASVNAIVAYQAICTLTAGRPSCEHREPAYRTTAVAPFGKMSGFTELTGHGGLFCGMRRGKELVCAELSSSYYAELEFEKPIVVARGDFKEVHAMSSRVVAVTRDGKMLAWVLYGGAAKPLDRLTETSVQKVATGRDNVCALRNGGEVRCWSTYREPQSPLPGQRVKEVAVGSQHGCAVNDRDELWCWGSNELAQLGDGATFCSIRPQDVTPALVEAFGGRDD